MHLVLVEDGAEDRELIEAALGRRGVAVTACASDAEFYGLLDRKGVAGIDGLIADVDLGEGTTGFDVARAARRYDERLPVVYVTSTGLKAGRHAVAGGVLLRKTTDVAELADEVIALLARRERHGRDGEPSEAAD